MHGIHQSQNQTMHEKIIMIIKLIRVYEKVAMKNNFNNLIDKDKIISMHNYIETIEKKLTQLEFKN